MYQDEYGGRNVLKDFLEGNNTFLLERKLPKAQEGRTSQPKEFLNQERWTTLLSCQASCPSTPPPPCGPLKILGKSFGDVFVSTCKSQDPPTFCVKPSQFAHVTAKRGFLDSLTPFVENLFQSVDDVSVRIHQEEEIVE